MTSLEPAGASDETAGRARRHRSRHGRGPGHGGCPDFRALVGEAGWARLVPAIRARFADHRPRRFAGTMSRLYCSRLGWCLAQVYRLIGTPLPPRRGADVAAEINLIPSADGRGGMIWERVYHYPHRPSVRIRSLKCTDRAGAPLERVGRGFGMRLRIFERDGALHFVSRDFFWAAAGLRVPLPAWLAPGTIHVIHTDAGDGRFRFRMTIDHPWFGRTFDQDGLFRSQGDLS